MVKHSGQFSPNPDSQNAPVRVTEVHLSEEPDVDVRCGYGSCKPEVLQKCNNPKMLVFAMCIFSFVQGFIVNGVTNVNIIPLERRFQLSSSRSAVIASAYDFSAAIFGLFVSYLGSGRNKSKWVAVAAFTMAVASLMMALPHFTTGLYQWGQGVVTTCTINGTAEESCLDGEMSGLQNYHILLVCGMVVFGLGGSILYTVGVAYIDDSVPAVDSPLYIGLVFTTAVLGPGIGYLVGGQLLSVYVDIDKLDPSTIPLLPIDPRWVGAWWISYVAAMVVFVLVVIPLSCFGTEMPTAKPVRESRVSQLHKAETDIPISVDPNRLKLREVPAALLGLFKNPGFSFTCLASVAEAINILGFSTFNAKFAATHFNLSGGRAALMSGAVLVPGATIGMFLGGFLSRRFKLKVKGMLKLILVTSTISGLLYNFLWLSCGETSIAGVWTPYATEATTGSLTATCNQDCHCNTDFYQPVCSGNDVEYFSPCHAGCLGRGSIPKTYANCSCAGLEPSANSSMVTSGSCDSSCSQLYVFMVLLFLVNFFGFLLDTPADMVLLRCIQENHRTFGIGVNRFIIRILGSALGPVLYGALVDAACVVWKTECGENSSCWVYDNFAMSRNFFCLAIGCKAFSLLCFLLAHCLYVPPRHSSKGDDNDTDAAKEPEELAMGTTNKAFDNNADNTD